MEEWILFFLMIVANGIIDCVLVAWLAGKRSKQALVAYLESDASDEMFDNVFKRFWKRLNSPSITTGSKIQEKDEAGAILKETPEVITPLENITRELGRYVRMNIGSMLGGKQKKVNELVDQIAQANLPGASSLQQILALAMQGRKGLDLEGLLTALIVNFIGKKDAGGGGGGGQGSW